MSNTLPRRRARVGGLCRFRHTAERVPAWSGKTARWANVRERCGNAKRRKRAPAGDFGRCGGEAGQSRGVVRAPQRSHLPAVRTVLGFCEGVPSAEKNSAKVFQNPKVPLFQGKTAGFLRKMR